MEAVDAPLSLDLTMRPHLTIGATPREITNLGRTAWAAQRSRLARGGRSPSFESASPTRGRRRVLPPVGVRFLVATRSRDQRRMYNTPYPPSRTSPRSEPSGTMLPRCCNHLGKSISMAASASTTGMDASLRQPNAPDEPRLHPVVRCGHEDAELPYEFLNRDLEETASASLRDPKTACFQSPSWQLDGCPSMRNDSPREVAPGLLREAALEQPAETRVSLVHR